MSSKKCNYLKKFIIFVASCKTVSKNMCAISDDMILDGFRSFDEDITKDYFYGYCRRAYNIYDVKYQLRWKNGLDLYSLAHEYYIQLLTHSFKPLLKKPKDIKLSTWMVKGFHFVVLDALKAYNKEFEFKTEESSEIVLEYIRSADQEEGMMFEVAEAVASHYHDRVLQEIARMKKDVGYCEWGKELHFKSMYKSYQGQKRLATSGIKLCNWRISIWVHPGLLLRLQESTSTNII